MDSVPSPPLPGMRYDGDELTTLSEMLDFYRTVMIRKVAGLSSEQLATTLPPSDLTLGGLIFHMAVVEDGWFADKFLGNPMPEPWASVDWEADWDWELNNASSRSPMELLEQFNTSVQRSRDALNSADSLDQLSAGSRDGQHWNLRWIMVHMIEEYARHCGHADFLRQSIDGAVDD